MDGDGDDHDDDDDDTWWLITGDYHQMTMVMVDGDGQDVMIYTGMTVDHDM